jgi:hypothetical protein
MLSVTSPIGRGQRRRFGSQSGLRKLLLCPQGRPPLGSQCAGRSDVRQSRRLRLSTPRFHQPRNTRNPARSICSGQRPDEVHSQSRRYSRQGQPRQISSSCLHCVLQAPRRQHRCRRTNGRFPSNHFSTPSPHNVSARRALSGPCSPDTDDAMVTAGRSPPSADGR